MGQSLGGGEIYDNFHAKATGTGSLIDSQEAGLRLSRTYLDRADTVQKLIEGIRSGWTGTAADAATQGLMPFAESALQTGQDLDSAQDLIYRQVDSFHSAAARVQPMPPEPVMQNAITATANNQPIQPMLDQIQAYNAAAANNVDVYHEYANASQFNAINTPDVSGTMTSETAPVRVTGSSMPFAMASPLSRPKSISNGTIGGARTPTAAPGPATMPVGKPGVSAPQQTSGSGSITGPVERLQSAPAPDSVAPTFGGVPTTTTADSPVGTPVPVVGSTTVKAIGTARNPVVARSNGANAGAIVGGGRGGVGADPEKPVGEPVSEPVGESAEPVAVGREGAPGGFGGPVGTGRGRDEEKEHQRKYELGEDPDALFVSPTGALAPEVLGELESERVARHERESGR